MRDIFSFTTEERKKHEAKFGGYNDFPPNWEPTTADEFYRLFFVYAADLVEHRQMRTDKFQGPSVKAILFHYGGGEGIAFVEQYESGWKEPKLFKFAVCVHEFTPVPEESGMCYHVSKCKKCGYKSAVDSSG